MEWQEIDDTVTPGPDLGRSGTGAAASVGTDLASALAVPVPICQVELERPEDTVISFMDIDTLDPPVGQGNGHLRTLIIVPDTNIWIHSLNVLEHLLEPPYSKYILNIIIPWMVFHELDGLKRGETTREQALRAGKFIHQLLLDKGPLKGQKPQEEQLAQAKYPKLSSDDSILQCALHSSDKYPQKTIIFISDDTNLRNKGIILQQSNVLICDSKSALRTVEKEVGIEVDLQLHRPKLKAKLPSSASSKKPANWTPPEWDHPKHKSRSHSHSHSHKSSSDSGSSSSFSSRHRIKRSRHNIPSSASEGSTFSFSPPPPPNRNRPVLTQRILFSGNSGSGSVGSNANTNTSVASNVDSESEFNTDEPMEISPVKKRFCPNDRVPIPVRGRSASPGNSNSKGHGRTWDDIWKLLHRTFSHIIEFKMKEDLGDTWEKSLKVKRPWTLFTALKCLDAHWRPIFSLVFGSRAKRDLEYLMDIVKNFNRYEIVKDGDVEEKRRIIKYAINLLGAGINFSDSESTIVKDPSVQECYTVLKEYSKTIVKLEG